MRCPRLKRRRQSGGVETGALARTALLVAFKPESQQFVAFKPESQQFVAFKPESQQSQG